MIVPFIDVLFNLNLSIKVFWITSQIMLRIKRCKKRIFHCLSYSPWNTPPKADLETSQQGGVVVSRWAHNSKVGGSKPLSATFLNL